MNKVKFLSCSFLSLSLVFAIASCNSKPDNLIVIGSKNFTEQRILGELLAQKIESNTNLKVERRFDLGGTFVCHQAITAGKIDTYVEYTGTAFTAILKNEPINDADKVYQKVKRDYEQSFNITWLPPLGFNNTFAMIIRGEDSRKLKVNTISQAAKFAPSWRAGFGYEFTERKDGLPGLSQTYGLRFEQTPKVMDLGLMYRALKENQVDIVAGNSTDGVIDRFDLVVLKDDRLFFPPYQAAPVIRQEVLQKHPELQQALSQLAGVLSDREMRNLNYQVDGEGKNVKQVVQSFLQSKGLVKNQK
ncbi:MAG TPA: glycine betaine ABC transporter substrate-binding protein [Leptolyngbyaceae cyanobacterium]